MKILIVAGASGGHIFPAVSLLENLKDNIKNLDALLVLPLRSQAIEIDESFQKAYISSCPINFNLSRKNIIAIFKFIYSWFESFKILLKFKPNIVIGFGTLDSVPLIMLAWLFRIKTLLHEQNVLPGKANQLLSRFVDKVAISFRETELYLGIDKDKIVLTGNPVRRQLKVINKQAAAKFFDLDSSKITLLALGGSQGSHKINLSFVEALATLKDLSSLQVIHICGESDQQFLNERYKNINIKARVFAFLKEMHYAYSLANLVICRAGASTITELCFFKMPAVIIPYPFAGAHQMENARILENSSCSIIIQDKNLSALNLSNILQDLTDNPSKLIKMASCYVALVNKNAGDALRDLVLSIQ